MNPQQPLLARAESPNVPEQARVRWNVLLAAGHAINRAIVAKSTEVGPRVEETIANVALDQTVPFTPAEPVQERPVPSTAEISEKNLDVAASRQLVEEFYAQKTN
ncbi:hypothetical protein KA047_01315 [Candidatus Saccharibacteria bacterium]|nr:hypothetical protein [Candidatus Saccharibacteria bacterium]